MPIPTKPKSSDVLLTLGLLGIQVSQDMTAPLSAEQLADTANAATKNIRDAADNQANNLAIKQAAENKNLTKDIQDIKITFTGLEAQTKQQKITIEEIRSNLSLQVSNVAEIAAKLAEAPELNFDEEEKDRPG